MTHDDKYRMEQIRERLEQGIADKQDTWWLWHKVNHLEEEISFLTDENVRLSRQFVKVDAGLDDIGKKLGLDFPIIH